MSYQSDSTYTVAPRAFRVGPSILLGVGLLTLALHGCATYAPTIPAGYTGPTASISDHGFNESGTKGQLFYVESVDGKPVKSGLELTHGASHGQGFSLTLAFAEHILPAQPVHLKIVGTHVTGAPIHEIASRAAGTFFTVEGDVALTPVAGHQYFVTGKLAKDASQVWISDADAEDIPVSEIVESKPK